VTFHDYVSPNFTPVVDAAPYFPNRVEGPLRQAFYNDGKGSPTITRNDPHRWYYDNRWPGIGFVNMDEGNLLYQLARPFAGKPALEIGCHVGYSAWHLKQAGVRLSVCDPCLLDRHMRASVVESLDNDPLVELFAGPSPQMAIDLGYSRGPWSFVFIDGNHDGPFPAIDALAANNFCAADAMITFHDAIQPAVVAAALMLQAFGWNLRFYDTSMIIACAWRGDVTPVEHIADSSILAQPLPPQLVGHMRNG
jgi:predicted O-methyltransferase YrrM